MKRDQTQNHNQDLNPKSDPNQKTKINFCLDLEFNSINFGIEINKYLKFLTSKNV